MQVLNIGDVFYLRSPFKSTVSPQQEKRLAHMLGTTSARPAVVIRPAYAWDTLHTIEVIPALSTQKPAVTFPIIDRYGYMGEADYSFCPHYTHTIPVNRLGRFIGRLTYEELEELVYAHRWIHDPMMQRDRERYAIPECYKGYVDTNRWAKTARPSFFDGVGNDNSSGLFIGEGNEIVEDAQHEEGSRGSLVGMKLDFDPESCIRPQVARDWMKTAPAEKPAEPTPTVWTMPEPEPEPEKVEIDYDSLPEHPISIVPPHIVQQELTGIVPDYKYFTDNVESRKSKVLTMGEIDIIRKSVNEDAFKEICKLYDSMKPIDQDIYCVVAKTYTICKLYHLNMAEAACMKRMAIFIHELPEAEYKERLATNKSKPLYTEQYKQKKKDDFEHLYPIEKAKPNQDIMLKKLAPFLNHNAIHRIPDELKADFVRLPSYLIRKAYSGKAFQYNYNKAFLAYKDELMSRHENAAG